MTLQAAGQINFSQIGVEAQKPLMSPVAFNDIELRKLAAKTADRSKISAADFYSRQYGVGAGYASADFTAVTGAMPNTVISSNMIYAPTDCSLAIFCDTSAQYSINGGAWVDKAVLGSVLAGQTIAVRCMSSPSYSTGTPVTVNMSGTIKTFSVTTGAQKLIQTPFVLTCSSNWSYDSYGHRNACTGASTTTRIGGTPINSYNFGLIDPAVEMLKQFSVEDLASAYGTKTANYSYDDYAISGFLTIACLDSENPGLSIESKQITSSGSPGSSLLVGQITILGTRYELRISASAYAGGSNQIFNCVSGWSLSAV